MQTKPNVELPRNVNDSTGDLADKTASGTHPLPPTSRGVNVVLIVVLLAAVSLGGFAILAGVAIGLAMMFHVDHAASIDVHTIQQESALDWSPDTEAAIELEEFKQRISQELPSDELPDWAAERNDLDEYFEAIDLDDDTAQLEKLSNTIDEALSEKYREMAEEGIDKSEEIESPQAKSIDLQRRIDAASQENNDRID